MPPVATTVAFWPSSSSMRSIMPSIMQALPSMMPLRIASIVLRPMAFFGMSRLMPGSCAARPASASVATLTPVQMLPPM